jgi:hypothetical protein
VSLTETFGFLSMCSKPFLWMILGKMRDTDVIEPFRISLEFRPRSSKFVWNFGRNAESFFFYSSTFAIFPSSHFPCATATLPLPGSALPPAPPA